MVSRPGFTKLHAPSDLYKPSSPKLLLNEPDASGSKYFLSLEAVSYPHTANKNSKFNVHLELPVERALDSFSLYPCMLVVQLSSPGLAGASRLPADFICAGVGSV